MMTAMCVLSVIMNECIGLYILVMFQNIAGVILKDELIVTCLKPLRVSSGQL